MVSSVSMSFVVSNLQRAFWNEIHREKTST
jgi:hypothetical protein